MALYIGNQKVAPTIVTTPLGIPLEVSSNGELQKPTSSFSWSLPSNATSITQSYILAYAFHGCTELRNIDLSNLIDISGYCSMQSAFYGCTGLTGTLDLSSLTTISGEKALYVAFSSTSGLTNINLSNLTTVSGKQAMYATFVGNTALTSINFPNLTTISGSEAMHNLFMECHNLKTVSFPALTSTSFGSYTDQFNYMLSSVIGCTVHFPSNLQSVIGSWTSVTSGFNGTNTTVLFDLPATE